MSKYVTHNQTPHHKFKQKSTLSQLNHIHAAPKSSCGVPLGQDSAPPPSPMTLISKKQHLKENGWTDISSVHPWRKREFAPDQTGLPERKAETDQIVFGSK